MIPLVQDNPLVGYLVTAIGVLGGVVAVLFWLLIKGRDIEVKRVVDLTVALNNLCTTLTDTATTLDAISNRLTGLDALQRITDETAEDVGALVTRFDALLARLDRGHK